MPDLLAPRPDLKPVPGEQTLRDGLKDIFSKEMTETALELFRAAPVPDADREEYAATLIRLYTAGEDDDPVKIRQVFDEIYARIRFEQNSHTIKT